MCSHRASRRGTGVKSPLCEQYFLLHVLLLINLLPRSGCASILFLVKTWGLIMGQYLYVRSIAKSTIPPVDGYRNCDLISIEYSKR